MGVFAYAFQSGVWMLFALLSLLAYIIIKAHLKLVHKLRPHYVRTRDDSLYELLTHLFQVETIDYDGPSMRVVSLFVTILSFLVLTYFTNSMKTDIVVVEDPKIIHNYDDLLANDDAQIIFPKLMDTISQFEFAEPQTKERMIWEKSLKRVKGDRSQMEYQFLGKDIFDLIRYMTDVAYSKKTQFVSCASKLYVGSVRKIGCMIKVLISRSTDTQRAKEVMGFYSWASKDPHAKETILTWAHSAFYDSPYLQTITRRVAWANDLGFMPMLYHSFDQQFINTIQIRDEKEGDIYRNCLADDFHLNMPHVDLAPFSPKQFKILSFTCASILILSFLAYVAEIIGGPILHHCRLNRRLRRRQRKLRLLHLQRELHFRRLLLRARRAHLRYSS